MYGTSDYRTEKPPLTQLQELTSVFPSPEEHSSNVIRPFHQNHQVDRSPRQDVSNFVPDYLVKERFGERECDSGYATDIVRSDKMCEREPDAGYGSDRPGLEPECETFSSDTAGARECDSGFAPAYPCKEETDTLSEFCAEGDPGPRDALADSDSGCADLTGKWEDETPGAALPGFQQAFGSTEIGRFSRNDFFTNPSPTQTMEPVNEPLRKTARKPRSPRVKQIRKERPESPKPRQMEPRREVMPHVPMPDGAPPCSPQTCGARYCPDYPTPPANGYPYGRSPSYASYPPPPCDYFRPFPFPLPYAQTWPEPRWPSYQPSYPQHYQQHYQPQQPWTSANVYPFMRLDY